MATGKKSAIVYSEWIENFEILSDEEAGKLAKHFFRYINDMNPEAPDRFTEMAFIPLKQALKRDLVKYGNIVERNRLNGSLGGRPRKEKPKKPSGLIGNPKKPKKADNDNDNDNDILLEKETKRVLEKWLDYRKEIKKPIKSKMTIKQIIKKIETEGAGRFEKVMDLSISNGWQGLFWDKEVEQKNGKENINAGTLLKEKYGFS